MNDFVAGAPADRLPTLVRTRAGYRVYDPALIAGTDYVVDDAGDLVYTKLPAGAMTGTAVVAAAVVALTVGENSCSCCRRTCTSRPTRWRSFSRRSRARWTCCST